MSIGLSETGTPHAAPRRRARYFVMTPQAMRWSPAAPAGSVVMSSGTRVNDEAVPPLANTELASGAERDAVGHDHAPFGRCRPRRP